MREQRPGLSHTRARQRVDAAMALFLTDRLPRTAALLQAGLLDETKMRTILSGTHDLEEETCRVVEARVIRDADLDVVDPLDVRADPDDLHARPGAQLPLVTTMTNPALERALQTAVLTVDAEAAARRAAAARAERHVRASALPDGMGALTVETGQEVVAAIVNDLDSCVARAKAAGDKRRADEIRCDELVHRMTLGAIGTPACPDTGRPSPERLSEQDQDCASGPRGGRYGRRGLTVGLTMPLSTWLGLADEPGLLDGYGPIAAALARQIAAEALRDHPTTTSWRCVPIHDEHRTVLGVGDLIPTPHHDPPPRLARLVTTIHPTCAYPGCPAPARNCDLDHRLPHEEGGATCSCNVQPLCRRHHRIKGTGMVNVAPVDDPDEPVGTLRWSSWTGREYLHRPPKAAVEALRPSERVPSWSLASEPTIPSRPTCPSQPTWVGNDLLAEDWRRSVAKAANEDERRRREQTRQQTRRRGWRAETGGGDIPPPS